MLENLAVRVLPRIGTKFGQVKEATPSHDAAERKLHWEILPTLSRDLPPRLQVHRFILDFNASFSHNQTNFFHLVQADVT